MKTERAVFANNLSDIKLITEYDRLYYGREFCERLLPSEDELKRDLQIINANNIKLTFVTPFVSDYGIEVLSKLINIILHSIADIGNFEIVVNDIGVFNIIPGNINTAAGRLMTKQKRDPRIAKIDILKDEAMKYYRTFSLDCDMSRPFVSANNIKRFEIDNVLQGIERQSDVKASIYVPYCYISTTRLCCFSAADNYPRYLRQLAKCSYECKKYDVYMNNKDMRADFNLKGNAVFYKNDVLPGNMENLHIDRIVYNQLMFKDNFKR